MIFNDLKLYNYLILIPALFIFTFGCNHTKEERQVISTESAPEAIGPYSQGILAGNTLYAAGQIGLDPESGEMAGDDLASQTIQTLENLKAVVEAAGMSMEQVVEVQVFLADINDFTQFNELYSEYFSENPPARAVIEASALPRNALVEVKLIAVNTRR
jgi:2-iminobutanoate/2-iminopropanoate deaminase